MIFKSFALTELMSERVKSRRSRNFSDSELLSLAPSEIAQALSECSADRRNAFGQFLCDHAISLRLRNDNEERNKIEKVLDILFASDTNLFDCECFVSIASECTHFFQQTGDERRAVALGKWALKKAEMARQPNLIRRAHNVLAAAYLNAFCFHETFNHLDKSLKLARQLGEPLFEMAVLANAASLLGEMGLHSEALRIAHHVSEFSNSSALYCYVHVQNACNAFQTSRNICDRASADKFYKIASKNVASASAVADDLFEAHFEWCKSLYLIDQGEISIANQFVEQAFAKRRSGKNIVISALHAIVRAECLIAMPSDQNIQDAKNSLKAILSADLPVPEEYFEIAFRTLIKVLLRSGTPRDLEEGEIYQQSLRDYLINVKHRSFFAQAIPEVVANGIFKVSPDPSYLAPSWIYVTREAATMPDRLRLADGGRRDPKDALVSVDLNLRAVRELEEFPPSAYFSIAESWAIAAEYSGGRSGRHCFSVGRVGRAIGRALGFPSEFCTALERAIRLHDIGKIVIDEDLLRMASTGDVDMYRSIREHTLAGERLLSGVQDSLMNLAARIARQHHEWWNGYGLPDGLRAEEISIEARICAVSDAYITLVDPAEGLPVWSHELAKCQLEAMAGFQLDPHLVSLLNSMPADVIDRECIIASTDGFLRKNAIVRSKSELYKTLDLHAENVH